LGPIFKGQAVQEGCLTHVPVPLAFHLTQSLGRSGIVPPLCRMHSLLAQQFYFCVTQFGEETRLNLLERLRFVSNCVVFTEEIRETWWRTWLRHCATSRKVSGSLPDGVIGIFHWHNPSGRITALRLSQPLTEMSKCKGTVFPLQARCGPECG